MIGSADNSTATSPMTAAPASLGPSQVQARAWNLMDWPRSIWLFLALVAVFYAPTIADAAHVWLTNDSNGHGILIFPVAFGMLWLQKDALGQVRRRPSLWGVPLLACGLLLKMGADIMQLRYIAMWSLVPTLAGGVWLLGGQDLWRLVRYPIWFLLFAGPLPNRIMYPLTVWIQNVSTVGAADLMSILGYPLLRHGNLIQISRNRPGSGGSMQRLP